VVFQLLCGTRVPLESMKGYQNGARGSCWSELGKGGYGGYGSFWTKSNLKLTNFWKGYQKANVPVLWRPFHELDGELVLVGKQRFGKSSSTLDFDV